MESPPPSSAERRLPLSPAALPATALPAAAPSVAGGPTAASVGACPGPASPVGVDLGSAPPVGASPTSASPTTPPAASHGACSLPAPAAARPPAAQTGAYAHEGSVFCSTIPATGSRRRAAEAATLSDCVSVSAVLLPRGREATDGSTSVAATKERNAAVDIDETAAEGADSAAERCVAAHNVSETTATEAASSATACRSAEGTETRAAETPVDQVSGAREGRAAAPSRAAAAADDRAERSVMASFSQAAAAAGEMHPAEADVEPALTSERAGGVHATAAAAPPERGCAGIVSSAQRAAAGPAGETDVAAADAAGAAGAPPQRGIVGTVSSESTARTGPAGGADVAAAGAAEVGDAADAGASSAAATNVAGTEADASDTADGAALDAAYPVPATICGAVDWRQPGTAVSSSPVHTYARASPSELGTAAAAATVATPAAATSAGGEGDVAFAGESAAAREAAEGLDAAAPGIAARHTTATAEDHPRGAPHHLEAADSVEARVFTALSQNSAERERPVIGGDAAAGKTGAAGGGTLGESIREATAAAAAPDRPPATSSSTARRAAPAGRTAATGAEELPAARENTSAVASGVAGSAAAAGDPCAAAVREAELARVAAACAPVYFPPPFVIPPPTLPLVLPSVLLPLQQEGESAAAYLPQQRLRAGLQQQGRQDPSQHKQQTTLHQQLLFPASSSPSSLVPLQQQAQRASELCASPHLLDWSTARNSLLRGAPAATAASAAAPRIEAVARAAASDALQLQQQEQEQQGAVRRAVAPSELEAAFSLLPTSLSSHGNAGQQRREHVSAGDYDFTKVSAAAVLSLSSSSSPSSSSVLPPRGSVAASASASQPAFSFPAGAADDPEIDNWWRYAPPSSLPEAVQQQQRLELLQRRQRLQQRLYGARNREAGAGSETRAAAADGGAARRRGRSPAGEGDAAATGEEARQGERAAAGAGNFPASFNDAAAQLVQQRLEELRQAIHRHYPRPVQDQQERREVLLLPSFEGDNSTAFLAGFAAAADAAEAAAGAAVAAASAAGAAAAAVPASGAARENAERHQAGAARAGILALLPGIVDSLRRQDAAITAAAQAAHTTRAAAAARVVASGAAAPPLAFCTWGGSRNFARAATDEPVAAGGTPVAAEIPLYGSGSSSSSGRTSSRPSGGLGSRRDGITRQDDAGHSDVAVASTEEGKENVGGAGGCATARGACEGLACSGARAAAHNSPASVFAAHAGAAREGGRAAATAAAGGGRDAVGAARGEGAADGERERVGTAEEQEKDKEGEGEDARHRESSNTPVVRFVSLEELLPATDLRCTYATHLARVYTQQLDLWQRYAAQLTLQLQISHFALSSAAGGAALSTPSSVAAASLNVTAGAALRMQSPAHFSGSSAVAGSPFAATAAGTAAAAASGALAREGRWTPSGGLQQNATPAEADYWISTAAAASVDRHLLQQESELEAAPGRDGGLQETEEACLLRSRRSDRPASGAAAGAARMDTRRIDRSAATSEEETNKRVESEAVEATVARTPAAGDIGTAGEDAAAAEAATAAAQAADGGAAEGGAADGEAAGDEAAAGEEGRRRVPAWQQYNVGLLVRLLLLLFLFDASKEVYLSTLLFGVLYAGGIFDPLIAWFQRSSHRQPLDVTLARLRRRRERRPLRRLQRQQRLLSASTEFRSERRRREAAGEALGAGTVEGDAASAAVTASQEQEQRQLSARVRQSNAGEEPADGTAGGEAAQLPAGPSETGATREARAAVAARAAARRAAEARAAAARAAASATAAGETETLSNTSDARADGETRAAGDGAGCTAAQQGEQEAQEERQQKEQPSVWEGAYYREQMRDGDTAAGEEKRLRTSNQHASDRGTTENGTRVSLHDSTTSRQHEIEGSTLPRRGIGDRRSVSHSDGDSEAGSNGCEGGCAPATEQLSIRGASGGVSTSARGTAASRETAFAEGREGTTTVRTLLEEGVSGEDAATDRHSTHPVEHSPSGTADHRTRRENHSEERSTPAATNPRARVDAFAASNPPFVAVSRNARARESSVGGRLVVAGDNPPGASSVVPREAAAPTREQQQHQRNNSSGSREVGRRTTTERRRRREAGWRSYCERAFYEGVVMFFLTFIPSWNPNPQYLRDVEDDEDEDEEEQEDVDDVTPPDENEDGVVFPERDGLDM